MHRRCSDLLQSADSESDGTEQAFDVDVARRCRTLRQAVCVPESGRNGRTMKSSERSFSERGGPAGRRDFTHRLAVSSAASSLELAQELARYAPSASLRPAHDDGSDLAREIVGRAVGKLASRSVHVCRIGVGPESATPEFWKLVAWADPPELERGDSAAA